MKKVWVFAIILCVALSCGCVNREGREMAEKTMEAIMSGDYRVALERGELAITKGYKDDDFVELVEDLRNYHNAKIALNGHDAITARVYMEQIDDDDENGLKNAVVELGVAIKELEAELKKVEEKIENLEKALWDGSYLYVVNEAQSLLDSEYISEEQKTEVGSLREKAQAKLEGRGEGEAEAPRLSVPATFSQQEAVEIARKELSMPLDAQVFVTDGGNYFQVSFTQYINTGNEVIEDGAACKIDKKTGKAYDHVG